VQLFDKIPKNVIIIKAQVEDKITVASACLIKQAEEESPGTPLRNKQRNK